VIDLAEAVLSALTPRGPREQLRLLVSGGWTVVQVYERLSADLQVDLAGGADEPNLAARRGIDQTHRALLALVEAGRVRRTRANYVMSLNTKGDRGMSVDLYRRVRGGGRAAAPPAR